MSLKAPKNWHALLDILIQQTTRILRGVHCLIATHLKALIIVTDKDIIWYVSISAMLMQNALNEDKKRRGDAG